MRQDIANLAGRVALRADDCANTALSSATQRVPVRSRAHACHRLRAGSCGRASPTAAVSNGFVPAVPILRVVRAKHSQDRRLIGAWQTPISAPDSSCHKQADSTPVLFLKNTFVQRTLVPP